MNPEHRSPYYYTVKAESKKGKMWRTFFALQITEIENIFVKENDLQNRNAIRVHIQQKQINFINTLYQPEQIHSIEYRFRVMPRRKNKLFQNVEIYILLSTNHKNKNDSLKQAVQNFRSVTSLLQSASQLYDITPIDVEEQFINIFMLPEKYRHILELRRRVSRIDHKTIIPKSKPKISLAPLEKKDAPEKEAEEKDILTVHPFIPVKSGYENLFKLFSRAENPLLISIRISPAVIQKDEDQYFIDSIRECENIARRDVKSSKLNKEQAEILARILLSHYLSLQDAPFQVHIFTASSRKTPQGIAELLGTEITRPIGGTQFDIPGEKLELLSGYSGGYDIYAPQNKKEQNEFLSALMFHENIKLTSALAKKTNEKRLQFLFDASEAACAFHLPFSINNSLSGFPLRLSKVKPLPFELLDLKRTNKKSGTIGINNYLGEKNEFHLPDEARRRHTYIVGQTGTGKSSILKSMILDDIKSGKGVGVFDPHGDLIDYVLARIPENRLNEVVLIDPSVKDYAVGVNLLENETIEQQNFIIQELIAMAISIFDPGHRHGFAGPVFENMTRMALQAIMSYSVQTPSFIDFPLFFYDNNFRFRVVKYLKENRSKIKTDPFLDLGIKAMSEDRDYSSAAGWIVSKYGRIVSDPSLRGILCQEKSTISFEKIMDDKKILLVNLNKSKIGSLSSEWLGMFLLTKIQAAAMKRVDISEAKRNDFYLYIDEFQNSATENFAEIFAESRKYRLNLTLANQYVAQIPDEIRSAIFGNVGTLISLRVGMEDAKLLEGQFQPAFSIDDFIQLPNWKAFVASTATGKRLTPFTIETIPFDTNILRSKIKLRKLKSEITAAHGKKKSEIEKYLKKRVSILTEEQEDVLGKMLSDAKIDRAVKTARTKKRKGYFDPIKVTGTTEKVLSVVLPDLDPTILNYFLEKVIKNVNIHNMKEPCITLKENVSVSYYPRSQEENADGRDPYLIIFDCQPDEIKKKLRKAKLPIRVLGREEIKDGVMVEFTKAYHLEKK